MRLSDITSKYGALDLSVFGERERRLLIWDACVTVKPACDYCKSIQPADPEMNCRSCGAPVILGAERLQ